MNSVQRLGRAGALLALTIVLAVALANVGGAANENALSKKEKRQGNKLWIEQGERAADADKLDGTDSSGFLRTGDQGVLAGFHINRPTSSTTELDRWFNNVNGLAPGFSSSDPGFYEVDMGFTVDDQFLLCSVDNDYVDTRNAICTVTGAGEVVQVEMEDPNTSTQESEVYVLILG